MGIADFLAKLLDNANFGKLVTDLVPGVVLLAALLLTLSLYTPLRILPFGQAADQEVAIERELDSVRIESQRSDSLRRISRPCAKTCQQSTITDDLRHTDSLRSSLVVSTRARRDSIAAAVSLSTNIQAFSGYATGLLFIALVLGIIMAQISGSLLYNGLFIRYFDRIHPRNRAQLYLDPAKAPQQRSLTYYALKAAPEFSQRLPDLETSYYRYLEVAMNLVVPLTLLGVALLLAVFRADAWGVPLGAGILCWVAAGLLYGNARDQFVDYMLKKLDVLRATEEAASLSAPPPPPKTE